MSDTLLKETDGLEETIDNYSNFDHQMPTEGERLLRAGTHWMEHSAYDHWGAIWFADGQFHERVMVYRRHVETVSAPTLQELVRKVNDEYGAG